jgi:hypothetical protein
MTARDRSFEFGANDRACAVTDRAYSNKVELLLNDGIMMVSPYRSTEG